MSKKSLGKKMTEGLKELSDKLERGEPIEGIRLERIETPDGPLHVHKRVILKGGTMNIAATMTKVLPELNEGLDGITLNLKPECENEWNEGYAIVQGLYYYNYDESDYFDDDRFKFDIEKKVKSHFPGCNVRFNWRSQEIEVSK